MLNTEYCVDCTAIKCLHNSSTVITLPGTNIFMCISALPRIVEQDASLLKLYITAVSA